MHRLVTNLIAFSLVAPFFTIHFSIQPASTYFNQIVDLNLPILDFDLQLSGFAIFTVTSAASRQVSVTAEAVLVLVNGSDYINLQF